MCQAIQAIPFPSLHIVQSDLTDTTRSFCSSIFRRIISRACFLGPEVNLDVGGIRDGGKKDGGPEGSVK